MSTALVKNIKNRVAESSISVSELERRAGLKPSALRNILHGRSKNPTIEIISQLAKQLNCSVEDLLLEQKESAEISDNINSALLRECSNGILDYMEKENIRTNMDAFFSCLNEVYKYTSKKPGSSPDECFIEWVGEKTFDT